MFAYSIKCWISIVSIFNMNISTSSIEFSYILHTTLYATFCYYKASNYYLQFIPIAISGLRFTIYNLNVR